MNTLQQYKCPCCDGAISFDSDSQNMKCPYCGTEFDIDTLSHYDEDLKSDTDSNMQWETKPGGDWSENEQDGLNIYSCNSCGGEIVGDETTAATKCPYCGNPVVMMGQFKGSLRPDYVIPFKLDKNDAMEALKNHYKGKRLLPKVFLQQNRIEEIKGVYVPFWLFDADADANMRFKASTIRHWSDSKYDYTETCYYSVVRQGTLGFERVPVDGSSKMDDALMESIEPYNFSEAVDFQTAYLAGYIADKYDVDADSSVERANSRIKASTEEVFRSTVTGYDIVNTVSSGVNLKNSSAKYALCPVWILNTNWNGQKYTFAMNGQTGKLVGNLPVDKGAYFKYLFGIAGIVGAVCFGISCLATIL